MSGDHMNVCDKGMMNHVLLAEEYPKPFRQTQNRQGETRGPSVLKDLA